MNVTEHLADGPLNPPLSFQPGIELRQRRHPVSQGIIGSIDLLKQQADMFRGRAAHQSLQQIK